jgi:hypothetical protein
MKLIKLNKLLILSFNILCIAFSSCKTINESPDGCVVAFIVSAEQRNMTRAWSMLGPEAQNFYNSQGEKMRKSGKGALENEISKIEQFRSVKKEYSIEVDKSNPNIINIVSLGGPVHSAETVLIDGSYKIKNEISVKNILEGITARIKKTDGY